MVMISVSHTEGSEFDPRPDYVFGPHLDADMKEDTLSIAYVPCHSPQTWLMHTQGWCQISSTPMWVEWRTTFSCSVQISSAGDTRYVIQTLANIESTRFRS